MERHFTASGIVFDDAGLVLLVKHRKLGLWLYPGGHLAPGEEPSEAALREIVEETGIVADIVSGEVFSHAAVLVRPAPFTVLDVPATDPVTGPHRHLDLVYLCRAVGGSLAAAPGETDGARWVPVADVAGLATPPELPALIAYAAVSDKKRAS